MMTNEIKVEIPTAEQLNKKIVDSIASSMIGEELEKSMKRYFESVAKWGSYSKAFDKTVESAVQMHLVQVLQSDEYRELMQNKIKSLLTEDIISRIIQAVFDSYFKDQ